VPARALWRGRPQARRALCACGTARPAACTPWARPRPGCSPRSPGSPTGGTFTPRPCRPPPAGAQPRPPPPLAPAGAPAPQRLPRAPPHALPPAPRAPPGRRQALTAPRRTQTPHPRQPPAEQQLRRALIHQPPACVRVAQGPSDRTSAGRQRQAPAGAPRQAAAHARARTSLARACCYSSGTACSTAASISPGRVRARGACGPARTHQAATLIPQWALSGKHEMLTWPLTGFARCTRTARETGRAHMRGLARTPRHLHHLPNPMQQVGRRPWLCAGEVTALQWSPDSELLAVVRHTAGAPEHGPAAAGEEQGVAAAAAGRAAEGGGPAAVVQIWLRSNWHWYLKQARLWRRPLVAGLKQSDRRDRIWDIAGCFSGRARYTPRPQKAAPLRTGRT